jgi:hypothetical protein
LRINAHAKARRRKLQIQLCDNQFKLKITQRENLTVFLGDLAPLRENKYFLPNYCHLKNDINANPIHYKWAKPNPTYRA